MTFSFFLQTIYKNCRNEITRQDFFVRDLFKSTGNIIFYTDDYYKRIFNGQKPFNKEIRKLLSPVFDKDSVITYLYSIISDRRVNDIFMDFGVSIDEERNISLFCEALSLVLQIFIKDEVADENSVSNTYYNLLDNDILKQKDKPNEKALCFAEQYFAQAIDAIASVKVNDSVLYLQRPFENFFDSVFKIFKIFNLKSTHSGRELLREAKAKILDGSFPEVDGYLSDVAEPGSEPIQLIKELTYIVYDNYYFKDRILQTTITIDDDSEYEKTISVFKRMKFYPVNEIYFSEIISFRETGKNINLIEFVDCIRVRITQILNCLHKSIILSDKDFNRLKKAWDEAYFKYQSNKIMYVSDGTYFPEEESIKYASTMHILFHSKEKEIIEPGNTKFPIKKDFRLKDYFTTTFRRLVFKINEFQSMLWGHLGHFEDLMAELYTFNKDGTYRWFMFPPTCKARVYRQIREVAHLVPKDGIEGFIYTAICLDYQYKTEEEREKLLRMKTEERASLGEELMISVGYRNHKLVIWTKSKEDVLQDKPSRECSLKYQFLLLLIASIDEYKKKNEEKSYQVD